MLKNKNKKQKIERPLESYYLKTKRLKKRRNTIRKYALITFFFLVVPAVIILYVIFEARKDDKQLLDSILSNPTIEVIKTRTEAKQAEKEEVSKYDSILSELGTMGQAIKSAGEEFGENTEEKLKLIGLMIGIANAESSLGKNFVFNYDKENCFNWWGLKGGNMTSRKDGSSLRCFSNETAGARTIAKTLKLYYLDEEKDTPEKIAYKYVGKNWTQYHGVWISNVNKFYN